jgi:Lectin C-type domain
MELVSIETASENEAILDGISRTNIQKNFTSAVALIILGAYNLSDAFWVSATDFGREGYFHWDSTGGALGLHADWAEDQPDNANEIEHCVKLGIGSYKWSDDNCILSNRYLCESKIIDLSHFGHNKRHLVMLNLYIFGAYI